MPENEELDDIISGDALTYDYDIVDELSSLNTDIEVLHAKLGASEEEIRDIKSRLNEITAQLWGKQRDKTTNKFNLLTSILAVVLGVILAILVQLLFNINI